MIANIERNINNLDDWMKPVEVLPSQNKNDKAKIVYEARGVCLILGPWNFPLGLVMGPLAAAIAAGNCCIVKLTDLCPATARVAAKIVAEAFEEKEVALFEGGVDVATALLEPPVQPHLLHGKHPRREAGHGGGRQALGHRNPGTGREISGHRR